MAGIRDELRTSRVMAGAAHGPAVASVGGAAIAPRAIRGLFTAAFLAIYKLHTHAPKSIRKLHL